MTFVICSVELWAYIVLNVSNSVHSFFRGHSALHSLHASNDDSQERVKE